MACLCIDKWAAVGTTNIELNPEKGDITSFRPMEQMVIKFTPKTKYVRVTFSASGQGSSYSNIPTNAEGVQNPAIQSVDFGLYYGINKGELKALVGKGSTCIASGANTGVFKNNVYGIQLDSWDSSFDTIIKVKKYEENIVSVYWKSYYPGSGEGKVVPDVTHLTTITNGADPEKGVAYNHRSLFIKEYRGEVLSC